MKNKFPPASSSLDNILHGALKKAPPEARKFQFSCVLDKDENGGVTISQMSLRPISIFFKGEEDEDDDQT